METGYKNLYNGWTNYATWRVNLEVFDGYPWEKGEVTDEMCKEIAEYTIFGDADAEECLATGYARSFLCDVNWQEIADALNDLSSTL